MISKKLLEIIVCPKSGSELIQKNNQLETKNTFYPIIRGIPILIDEEKSLFKIDYFTSNKETTFDSKRLRLKKLAKSILPSISKNLKSKINYIELKNLLLKFNERPKVLVIGGGIEGADFKYFFDESIDLIETDVSFGPRTKIIADAHCLPFKEKIFDCVIVQAVLEHVLDPKACVEEISRVIKDKGYVYAETPFMQQVHMAPYDFTRFTYLGHRNLFSHYAVIKSGSCIGPGSALAWSYLYFLMCFSKNKIIKYTLGAFALLTSFWLKYFDYLLINKDDALDAASAYFFIFQKLKQPISDNDIINDYKGTRL
jgi:SAM-dependent methyltransferase